MTAVYAIRHPHGFYKIGKSKQPYRRYVSIRSHTPYDLELYAILTTPTDGFSIESEIHGQLGAYNWKGEWFNVPKEVLDNVFEMHASKCGFQLQHPRVNSQDSAKDALTEMSERSFSTATLD